MSCKIGASFRARIRVPSSAMHNSSLVCLDTFVADGPIPNKAIIDTHALR